MVAKVEHLEPANARWVSNERIDLKSRGNARKYDGIGEPHKISSGARKL